MKILYITSMPLNYSGGLALDHIKALKENGYDVDVLTKEDWPTIKQDKNNELKGSKVFTVYNNKTKNNLKNRIYSIFKIMGLIKLRHLLEKPLIEERSTTNIRIEQNGNYIISNPNEECPPVPIKDILNKIRGKYDLIFTLFLEHMLTIPSLLAIYNKTHCPIIISCVDQAPFTGGCWYSLNCERFKQECGMCPALNSNDINDQSHKNYIIKKNAYAKMNYLIITNHWMMRYAKDSKLFDEKRLLTSCILIDEDRFKILNRKECKKRFGFNQKEIVLLARYHSSKNKGFGVFIDSLKMLYQEITNELKQKIKIVIVGTTDVSTCKDIKFKKLIIPELNINELIKLYNASSFFVSPSISDGGPSMVNQSIMCGTPVCCFNIGTAIDVIKNGKNGYKEEETTPEGLKNCLMLAVNTPKEKYFEMRKASRLIAMKNESKLAFSNRIEKAYRMVSSFVS